MPRAWATLLVGRRTKAVLRAAAFALLLTAPVSATAQPAREVWLGCAPGAAGVPAGTTCFSGRLARAPCCVPSGRGIVHDESSWKKLWDVYGRGRPPRHEIRWDREMVYLVSAASDIDRFNRAVEFRDSLVIELGPDSLRPASGPIGEPSLSLPFGVVLPRFDKRIAVRYLSGRSVADGSSDRGLSPWDSLADADAAARSAAVGTYVLRNTSDTARPVRHPPQGPPFGAWYELLAGRMQLAPHGRLNVRLTVRKMETGGGVGTVRVKAFWTLTGDSLLFYDAPSCHHQICSSPYWSVRGIGAIAGDTAFSNDFMGFIPQPRTANLQLHFVRAPRRRAYPKLSSAAH